MSNKGAIVPLTYWDGEGADAHIVRSQGVRVVLFYTPDGYPTMVVDRPPDARSRESDEYEDSMMMRWHEAVRAQFARGREGSPSEVEQ